MITKHSFIITFSVFIIFLHGVLAWSSDDKMSLKEFEISVKHLALQWSVHQGVKDLHCLRGFTDYFNSRTDKRIPNNAVILMPLIIEYLSLEVELYSVDNDTRNVYERRMGDLLPASLWGKRESVQFGDVMAMTEPPHPSIPKMGGSYLLDAASNLARAGLWDLAWRQYAEAAYSKFGPPWTFVDYSTLGTWLSPEAAIYWAEAGECARRAGKDDVAAEFLMKAAVFCNDDLQPKIEEIAKRLFDESAEHPGSTPIDPLVRREALTKTVRIYAEMNAHPRALALIEEYPEAFEDADALRKEIEQQWIALVKDLSKVSNKIILRGVLVHPNGKPLDVKFPWAFSDEAATEARKLIMEKLVEEND